MLAKIKQLAQLDWLGAKGKAQVLRFIRLAGVAFVASGVVPQLIHGQLTRGALVAAVVGAVEVGVRQVFPTVKLDPPQKDAPAA